jgi:hypothetical protein
MEINIKDIQLTAEKLCEKAEFKINPKTIVEETKTIFIKTNPVDCIRFDVTIDKDSVVFEKS